MLRIALVASLLTLCGVSAAHAAETTASFQSSASVIPSCSITQTHQIGTLKYDPVGVNATNNSTTTHIVPQTFGRLQVVCNRQAGIKVSFGEGLNPSPGSSCDAPLRNMKSASGALLSYRVNRQNAFLEAGWVGCGLNNTVDLDFSELNTRVIPLAIQVPAGQAAEVGDYSDTVTATVIF